MPLNDLNLRRGKFEFGGENVDYGSVRCAAYRWFAYRDLQGVAKDTNNPIARRAGDDLYADANALVIGRHLQRHRIPLMFSMASRSSLADFRNAAASRSFNSTGNVRITPRRPRTQGTERHTSRTPR